jgi:Sulfatase
MMAKPFKGTINVDIRDSEPDWAPFEPPIAPYGAPNVLYIVLDDVGFSALDCYGGPIETPNIGTLKRVAIDVSGEPYLDLEREAVAMMARE